MQQNAKRTQIERKKNVLRTDPQIRELSGNDFNPAKEPRTETIVENKNSSVCRKKELILNISKNFNRIEGPGSDIVLWQIQSYTPGFFEIQEKWMGWSTYQLFKALQIYDSWAKGPWKGFPLRKPLDM